MKRRHSTWWGSHAAHNGLFVQVHVSCQSHTVGQDDAVVQGAVVGHTKAHESCLHILSEGLQWSVQRSSNALPATSVADAKAGISPAGASSMVAALCSCTDLALSTVAKSKCCAFLQLFLGDTNRTISETPMNQASSRSHCVFTIYMEARQASTTSNCLAGLQHRGCCREQSSCRSNPWHVQIHEYVPAAKEAAPCCSVMH